MSEDILGPEQETPAPTGSEDTKHEAHPHARPRVAWGVAAVLLVGLGFFVWSQWGEGIKQACMGDNGACVVELEGIPEGGTQFAAPEGY